MCLLILKGVFIREGANIRIQYVLLLAMGQTYRFDVAIYIQQNLKMFEAARPVPYRKKSTK